MAYDYVTKGAPTIPVPGSPALAVDIANDALYIGNSSTGEWVAISGGGGGGDATGLILPVTSSPTVGTIQQDYPSAGGVQPILHSFGADVVGLANIFVGRLSGNFTNTALLNAGFGTSTLSTLTTGSGNSAFGANAGTAITTGDGNTTIGIGAGTGITTGANNTFLGQGVGTGDLTGSNNTTVGSITGANISSGSSNIVIGAGADVVDGTLSNQLNIGKTIYGTGLNGPNTGSIGINVPTPTNTLDIKGGVTFSGSLNPSVAITANGAVPVTGSANYIVTVATNLTIAAPSVDDTRIEVTTFDTAAPVLVFTGSILNSGSTAVDIATFAAFAGASLTIVSHSGRWNVINQNAVAFS